MSTSGTSLRPRFLNAEALGHLCPTLHLSRRESQIVAVLLDSTKEDIVARELDMSPHTLRTHVERLYRKLQVRNRTQLVVRLYEAFLALTSEEGNALPPICSRRAAGKCRFAR